MVIIIPTVVKFVRAKKKPVVARISTTTTVSTAMTSTTGNAKNSMWKQEGVTVAGGNGPGDRTDQLNSPLGFTIDDNLTLYIVEETNKRVVKWIFNSTNGEVIVGGIFPNEKLMRLAHPIDVVIDENDLIVCDFGNSRLIRLSYVNFDYELGFLFACACFSLAIDLHGTIFIVDVVESAIKQWKKGEFQARIIAGGNNRGDGLNQLNEPRYLSVDRDSSLYISDTFNNRIMKWIPDEKEGVIVAGEGAENNLTDLSYPAGLIFDDFDNIYVIDSRYVRVTRFALKSREKTVIVGGRGAGNASYQLHDPQDILFDRYGNLYVADTFNHRIQKFYLEN
ncbi:unnamed protein product [Adineta ricciae]|uniref:Uncharacterized protein n=1 Tax=Adineta ricciae TaxID=249248 RepID=A0A816F5C1_ADIRI|nr:unnamed protein product [Adineta ricciae]